MTTASTETSAAADLEVHRRALTGHCYRMLGSPVDADDAVQETMVRAWRSLDRFDGRASLRTWLHRIATNVCLDALVVCGWCARLIEEGPAGTIEDELVARPRTHWLEPISDARALPTDGDPSELAIQRESIRLAFVAALQHLPPKQRAVLLLSEVVGWSAAEIADGLDLTVAAVNSALQRARATLATRDVVTMKAPLSDAQSALLARYVEAFERYDVEALERLLHEDAAFSMPPFDLWLRGRGPIIAWLLGRGAACRGSKLVPITANGAPAFAHYKPDGAGRHRAWALLMLETSGDQIVSWTSFLDVEHLFPIFDLPLELPQGDRPRDR